MKSNLTLKDLAVKHPYYASDNNYYSNDAAQQYATWPDFYEEYHESDIDLNLVYRWDIHKEGEIYSCSYRSSI